MTPDKRLAHRWRTPAWAALAAGAALSWPSGAAAEDGEFNARGNVLIADQFKQPRDRNRPGKP